MNVHLNVHPKQIEILFKGLVKGFIDMTKYESDRYTLTR